MAISINLAASHTPNLNSPKVQGKYPNGDRDGTLLASDNFESSLGSITQSHAGETRFAIVTSNPKNGTKAMRMNLKEGRVDPITGLTGHGLYTANWMPSVSMGSEMTWVQNFRFDACDWNVAGDAVGNQVDIKLGYLMGPNPNNLSDTFYLAGTLGNTTVLNIADNGGGLTGWENRAYGWRTGGVTPRSVLYMTTGFPSGADATYHEFKFQIKYNYQGLGYSKARMIMDGHIFTDANNNCDAQGWFNMPPEMIVYGFRLCYTTTGATSIATDVSSNYACGVQYDDFAVYNGIV